VTPSITPQTTTASASDTPVAPPSDAVEPSNTATTTRRVLVTVGTDHHPFDRIVTWFDSWAADRDDTEIQLEALIQRATAKPGKTRTVELLAFDELVAEIKNADIIVTHGGPGSIFEARRWGKLPIVVARDPDLGEHVDNHQQLFAERMVTDGQILLARTESDLRDLLDDMMTHPQTVPPHDSRHVEASVQRIGQIVDRLVAGHRR